MINRMILIFEIVNFLFLDGDVPRSPSYDVLYIILSLFVLQDCVLMLVTDFNTRNLLLTAKFFKTRL